MEIFKHICPQRGVGSDMVPETQEESIDRWYSKGFERTSQIEGKAVGYRNRGYEGDARLCAFIRQG